MNKPDNKILITMYRKLEKAPPIYQPSAFWQKLNRKHANYLSRDGFENFKRSINREYFSWGILSILRYQLYPVIGEIARGNFSPFLESHFGSNYSSLDKKARKFNPLSAFIYKAYVACLMEHILRMDTLHILEKIKEPLIGNPYVITYKGKSITQDLCNSIHEFYSIQQKIKLPKNARIADLGAGYGRLGYVFLKIISGSSYCVIDIPAALFISQNYLKAIFPKEKVFLFRPFSSYNEIKSEFESSRIKFLMPHQLGLLPEKYFDLFINISSLHEMTRSQIKNYIELINRLCRGHFYTKQWRKSETKDNLNIKESEYPIPKSWKVIARNSPHPIQKMFFDTLYKIGEQT